MYLTKIFKTFKGSSPDFLSNLIFSISLSRLHLPLKIYIIIFLISVLRIPTIAIPALLCSNPKYAISSFLYR